MAQSPNLEDCLKLLKGERDEQRLAGLLLATKFCNGDDHASIRRVYEAVGARFLDRLLRTGMGEGAGAAGGKGGEDRDAYLQLSVTLLAAICRVPDIASSKEMVSRVPLILEVMSKRSHGSHPSVIEESYEFLFLVVVASEEGQQTFYEAGGISMLASNMPSLPDGSHSMKLAMKLVQLTLSKGSLGNIYSEYSSKLTSIVATIARQFALLHNALKFEALHLLSAILSSKYAVPLHDALRSMLDGNWAAYIRIGVVAILQNRVPAVDKFAALVLAESLTSTLGETWLIDERNLPNENSPFPVDRCLLLSLESSRVEVAVLLNELAYLKYEAASSSSSTPEAIPLKQCNLAITFSLIERIIKLISNLSDTKGASIDERTIIKVITGLNETIDVVLEFLKDAKDHGQRKGDDLLASIRLIGSYLAEAPLACKEKVLNLLEYMLSVEGDDESSPFYSVCFLLPMLCQITMEFEGCKAFTLSGGHKAVLQFLVKAIGMNSSVEDSNTIFLACDTIMNFLLKRPEIQAKLDRSDAVQLLRALAYWTENIHDPSVITMASTICSLIFDSTSERDLLSHPEFGLDLLNKLSQLIATSLATSGQDEMSEDARESIDLRQIIFEGHARWADQFPHVKQIVERVQAL
ncbi:hypothetical protein Sjap_011017 [Stephania japonica]|uniref:Neurochondrin n=1 Tax=Stephania japonica TaxID=461633 RepID=A0AAP0JCF7_9MAGN